MAKTKKKQTPILSPNEIQAAKQLDALIGRCYKGMQTKERLPPLWTIIEAALRIHREARNLPAIYWDLEHQCK